MWYGGPHATTTRVGNNKFSRKFSVASRNNLILFLARLVTKSALALTGGVQAGHHEELGARRGPRLDTPNFGEWFLYEVPEVVVVRVDGGAWAELPRLSLVGGVHIFLRPRGPSVRTLCPGGRKGRDSPFHRSARGGTPRTINGGQPSERVLKHPQATSPSTSSASEPSWGPGGPPSTPSRMSSTSASLG